MFPKASRAGVSLSYGHSNGSWGWKSPSGQPGPIPAMLHPAKCQEQGAQAALTEQNMIFQLTGVANRNLGAEWQPAMTSQHNFVARAAFGWLTKGQVRGSEKQFSIYRESWSSWCCWICVTLWLIFFKRSLEVLENTALEVKMKRKFPY